jgi:hypothetical protein
VQETTKSFLLGRLQTQNNGWGKVDVIVAEKSKCAKSVQNAST